MPWGQNVDVISVCSAEGKIRPLRIRMETEDQEYLRVDIDEVISTSSVSRLGSESETYLCKTRIWGRMRLFELKYTIRSHSWQIGNYGF